ncbi:DUF418 domain-containing protein [Corynebacterium sp. H113]|uniref:DUF418 domain-containing protein n=1 Tax=Corynebacterium sp. H113 TaxID=3133419 RepID=UPI0030B6674F
MPDNSTYLVEGHLPPGQRPTPGPRGPREVWRGIAANESASDVLRHDDPSRRLAPGGRHRRRRKHSTDLRLRSGRIEGIDVARGFALIGMVLVHTFPTSIDGEQTLMWLLFSGKSAPLFAVLAGVSLAFMTGGDRPYIRSRLRWSKSSILVRAFMLLLIGLTVNTFVPLLPENILPYYGLMFLFALVFIDLRIRQLLVTAFVMAQLMPTITFFVLKYSELETIYNPDFFDIMSDPVSTIMSLLFTGVYPVAAWMAYICLGLALGRMALQKTHVQWAVMLSGLVAAAATFVASNLIILWLPTNKMLVNAIGGPGREARKTIQDVLTFGAYESPMPTNSLLWLLANGPHLNTPVSTIYAAGLACIAIGGLSLLTSKILQILRPLAMAGSMTLTLYLAHIVCLTFMMKSVFFAEHRLAAALIQIGVAIFFAYLWRVKFVSGPLEKWLAILSRSGATTIERKEPPKGDAQRRVYSTKSYHFAPEHDKV